MPFLLWLSMLASAVLLILLPFVFSQVMLGALGKLHISPDAALLLMIAIIIGSFINIPVKRIAHQHAFVVHPFAAYGFAGRWPRLQRMRRETVIAVNAGGCVIPVVLVLYELAHLEAAGHGALATAAAASLVNTVVCYLTARPVPGVGIVMPGLLSAFIAAGLAMLLAHGQAAPVAFVAGVMGPLIGADLLHLKDLTGKDLGGKAVGIMSIGGAGTFDGIVLSGIVAAYLA
jgi:uncharacterized membrane protein